MEFAAGKSIEWFLILNLVPACGAALVGEAGAGDDVDRSDDASDAEAAEEQAEAGDDEVGGESEEEESGCGRGEAEEEGLREAL